MLKDKSSLLFSLFLAGIFVCLYLLTISFDNKGDFCLLAGSDCAAVVNTSYGSFFGIPVASFGLAYFVVQSLLYGTIILLFRSHFPKMIRLFSLFINLAATSFSIYFLYTLFVLLDETCIACLTIHLINFTTLALGLYLYVATKKQTATLPVPQKPLIIISPASIICGFSLLAGLVIFLGVNFAENRYQLNKERQKISTNLQYYLFIHGQNEKFEFMREKDDLLYGEPGIAIHQLVLFYKEGCRHCQQAERKLTQLVKDYNSAIYLIMKNVKNISAERRKELQLEHTPVLFINGKRADGWELPGFMENFTEDCGC